MIICVIYALVMTGLLLSYKTVHYVIVKTIASASFVIFALINAFHHHSLGLLLMFLPGLLLFMSGDIILATRKKGCLKYGMMAFLAGNLCFLFGFLQLSAWHMWALIAGLVMLMGLSLVDAYVEMIDFGKHKLMAFLYAFILSVTCLQCGIVYMETQALMFLFMTMGYVLYLLSDIILMFVKFGSKPLPYLVEVNLFIYYAGMFLIAYGFIY